MSIKHGGFGRGFQHVAGRELFGLRIARGTNPVDGAREIVSRVSELHIWSKQNPIGTGLAKRHADAAGINHANPAGYAVERHVGVTADDDTHAEAICTGRSRLKIRARVSRGIGPGTTSPPMTEVMNVWRAAPLMSTRKSGLIVELVEQDSVGHHGAYYFDIMETHGTSAWHPW